MARLFKGTNHTTEVLQVTGEKNPSERIRNLNSFLVTPYPDDAFPTP